MALGTSNDSTLTTPIETMVARCIADQGETESSDAECNPVREKNKKRTYVIGKEGSRELDDGKEDGNVGSLIRLTMRLGLMMSIPLPRHVENERMKQPEAKEGGGSLKRRRLGWLGCDA